MTVDWSHVAVWLVLVAASLISAPAIASDGGEPLTTIAPPAALSGVLVEGVLAALDGDAKAIKSITRAGLMAPELSGVDETLGAAALLLGDLARARAALDEKPAMAVYRAMALNDGAGGLSRAKELLAKESKRPDQAAQPGVLFLAALAFYREEQRDVADGLLARAVRLAPSALDESFAPDPAVGMVRAALGALRSLGEPEARDLALQLAEKLLATGRRDEAIRIAQRELETGEVRARARRILIDAWMDSSPRRALELVSATLKDDPGAVPARVRRAELLLRLGDVAGARRESQAIDPEEKADRARLFRVRAQLVLESGGDPTEALQAAESAAALEPHSDDGLLVLARALLATGHQERATAFAHALYDRRPKTIDPFAVLAAISEAKKDPHRARAQKLRSDAFRAELTRIRRAVERRESVIRAVRDSEGGLGVAGLEALRGEEPMLSLPLDLALARQAKAGDQRAARDRILASCVRHFADFLRARRGWAHYATTASPYGEVQPIELPLTAADPGRCIRAPQNARKPKSG